MSQHIDIKSVRLSDGNQMPLKNNVVVSAYGPIGAGKDSTWEFLIFLKLGI